MIRPILTSKNQKFVRNQRGAVIQLFEQTDAASAPLRERLCTVLRLAISQGILLPFQRLPSSRLLASDLKISRITAEAAYGQIEAEGYITRQVGKGTFVSDAFPHSPVRLRSSSHTSTGATQQLAQTPAISSRGAVIIATGGCQDPRLPLPFAAGSPDLRAFPVKTWRQLTNKALRFKSDALFGYGDPQGYLPLREAVAGYLQQSRGVKCCAEHIVITTSSQQALQLLATLLIDDGEPVWTEQPGYLGARNAFTSAGARLYGIPVDEQGMRFDDSASAPKLIYLTPSHHYPSGISLSLSRRLSLLDYAKRHQSWIVEDDYDSELHYDGRPFPAMQGLDNHHQVIYLGTFSKVLFPSLRVAYMVLPPGLVKPMTQLRTVYDGHTSQLMQAVTAEFIQQGHFAAHLRYMRQLYQSRRDHLLAQINQKLSHWMQPQPAAGGLQLSVRLPHGQEEPLTQQALKLGVITPGLSALYLPQTPIESATRDGWLLGFSALTPAEITAAIDRLTRIKIR
ncbi:aminotransferase class I/II-fold pyridoxal phosphate-dependent enzyme [Rouxiella sp. S1S-2]|uniref:MocR-like pyridoxine biosynthesis transcription factor PdxR n=1 Tax=Rouxiella sp. S1S-2 TaxID=2653856 RepID=UPI0012645CAC|nr:PLP-dependent aminotransferase family protein [Rouxiella sp. S1S-2]KAB7895869.1 aminotransferase class I/II-fold pyridoxal phosphate-dependent enzyme [Rouxiella sp. S1S-2]